MKIGDIVDVRILTFEHGIIRENWLPAIVRSVSNGKADVSFITKPEHFEGEILAIYLDQVGYQWR